MGQNISNVYLYEVDDLLGGDALSLYDLVSLASSDFKWQLVNQERIIQSKNAS